MPLSRHKGTPEHNIIQVPSILRRLRDRLGLRQMHVAPVLNEGLQAVLVVDDLQDGAYNRDVKACMGTIAVAGVAALFSSVWLSNAAGRNVVLRVRRFECHEQTLAAAVHQVIVLPQTAIVGTTPGNKTFQDGRDSGGPQAIPGVLKPTADLSGQAAAAFGDSNLVLAQQPALVPPIWDLENLVLPPGFAIGFQQTTANLAFRVNVWWDEMQIQTTTSG